MTRSHWPALAGGILGLTTLVLAAPQAFATGEPPAGNVIYELTGQTFSSTYQQATANFTAGSANTILAFAFRDDPSLLYLSNVSLVDQANPATDLLINGDFSSVTGKGRMGGRTTAVTDLS